MNDCEYTNRLHTVSGDVVQELAESLRIIQQKQRGTRS